VFGLFKRPVATTAPPVPDQLSFSATVFDVAMKYVANEKKLPISKDENATIIDTWIGTRLEAVSQLKNFGAVNLEFITDPSKHPVLLESIVQEADNSLSVSFFSSRQATGDAIKDSISAILNVYDYLYELELEFAVPFRFSFRSISNGSVMKYASFVLQMQKLLLKWQGFDMARAWKVTLPDQPETIFVRLWQDITFRAKMIALCSRLGPHYIAMWAAARKLVIEGKENSRTSDTVFVKVLSAKDPDGLQRTLFYPIVETAHRSWPDSSG
jgi:hypothetical protein